MGRGSRRRRRQRPRTGPETARWGWECTARTFLAFGQVLCLTMAWAGFSQLLKEPLESSKKFHDVRILKLANGTMYGCV